MPEMAWVGTSDAAEETKNSSNDDAEETGPPIIDAYAAETEPKPAAPDDAPRVEERLSQLKRAMADHLAWQSEDQSEWLDTPYAFQVVRSWLALVAVAEGADSLDVDSRLVGDDVDHLAQSIVARAENSFRDSLSGIRLWLDGGRPNMKVLYLVEALLQLPNTYRNWQLRHHHTVGASELEGLAYTNQDAGEPAWPLVRLYRCLVQDGQRATHLLVQTLRFTELEAAEIVDASLQAFNWVLRERG